MANIVEIIYKRSNFIERAIDSVLNQTYQDIEIIVVGDNNLNTDY